QVIGPSPGHERARRPCGRGLCHELVAIEALPLYGQEEVPGVDIARVALYPAELGPGGKVTCHLGPGCIENLPKRNWGNSHQTRPGRIRYAPQPAVRRNDSAHYRSV